MRLSRVLNPGLPALLVLLIAIACQAQNSEEKKVSSASGVAAIEAFIAEQNIDKSKSNWKTSLPKPPEASFEAGTDHSSGVEMADVMFRESGADARYRAMIVVTDGRPNGTHPWAGYERMVDGHVETRWREYQNYAGRSTAGVRTATINATSNLWDQLNVHTWAVSLVADDPMMSSMVQGDGYYVRTNDPDELSVLLAQIISELPLAVVR